MKLFLLCALLGILVVAGLHAFDRAKAPPSESETSVTARNAHVPISASASGPEAGNSNPSDSAANSSPKPPSSALNSPGEDFDFSSYLQNGRVSIAYFYADWCPACRELSPRLAMINQADPNTQVLFLNIGDWESPIVDRYRIHSVPFLRIYDKNGYFIAEGDDAKAWLQLYRSRR